MDALFDFFSRNFDFDSEKMKVKALYLTSENITSSIPLEVAGVISKNYKNIDLLTVTYYGDTKNEPPSNFQESVETLNAQSSFDVSAIKKLHSLMKQFQPDVIHLHHSVSALIAAILGRMTKIKLIIKTEHNNHRFYKFHQKIFNVPTLLLSHKIICNSKHTETSFYPWEKIISRRKTTVIYNGIDIQKIESFQDRQERNKTREMYGIQLGHKLFVSAARLVKQKNTHRLIEAFAAAVKEDDSIRLIIAGGGPLQAQLESLVKKLGLKNYVQLPGSISREDVYRLLNAADFFTTISLWEGFCNAVVEAMAARLPVLCSDIPTLREVVGEQVGLFVGPYSIESIKKGILKFADLSPEAVASISQASYHRATQTYSIEKTARHYVEQYMKFQQ